MEPCIVVIEGSRDVRELLCDLFTDAGYAVAVYATHEAAIADLSRMQPDVIVLDWLFERAAAGLQVLQSLRLRSASSGLPVVIFSPATREMQDLEAFLLRRGVRVVYKPFLAGELLATVDAAVRDARGAPGPAQAAHADSSEPRLW